MDNNEIKEMKVCLKKKIGETQMNNILNSGKLEEYKITKILTISAKPYVEKVETLNAEVKANGYVEYDLLAVLEDNTISSITEKSPFTMVFESKEISNKNYIDVKANVVEINNVSDENLSFNSVINFQIFSVYTLPSIKCPEEREGVFVNTKEINFSTHVGNVDYNFQIDFNENKDSKFNKVLYTSSSASIKNVVPANNYFIVNGDVFTTIVYQNEDGIIKSIVKENEFSEEVEVDGMNKDCSVNVRCLTKEIEVVENLETKTFNFVVPINIKGEVFERQTCKTILDAYSLTNEVNLTTTSFEDEVFSTTKQVNGSISTTATIDENLEPIERVLAVVPNNVAVINQIVKNGSLLLEGIVNTNIIYNATDENNSEILNSFDIDVPYSLNINIEELKEGDDVFTDIAIKDVSIKSKFGRELEIFIDFKINYTVAANSTGAVVSEINVGEEKQKPDYTLEIYLTNNESSLWEVAKKLNVTIEDLIKQNGELTMPLQQGQQIVSYKQNISDFE